MALRTPQARVLPFRKTEDTRTRDEREFLPAAIEIVETPASPAGRAVALSIVAAAVFAIIWSCIGKVDIVATAQGRIVPVGQTKTIQPEDTGIVSAIRVADGDHVKAGQTLIELDAGEVTADHDRFARDLSEAQLDLASARGLQAVLASGDVPRLIEPPASASAQERDTAEADMRAEAAEQQAKLGDLDQQIVAKRAEADETAATIAKLRASLPLVQQQADIRTKLKDMEFGNKIEWLNAEQRLVEQQHDIASLGFHEAQARAAALSLEKHRAETEAEYAKSVLDELKKALGRSSELISEYAKSSEKLVHRTLTAPIDGTVQQLAIHTVGGVVTPAQPLMAIVPDHPGLIVEAMVKNGDVGFVHAGQKAALKIETFTFTRYGLIEGTVLSVSHDTVGDPNGDKRKTGNDPTTGAEATPPDPAYTARIALARDWIDTETGRVPLGAGMAVTAEIQTGRRRVIDYLLSPLVRHVSESGHER